VLSTGTVGPMARARIHGGTEVEYEVTGAGPPVVLVHGITESRRSWDPLVSRLAEDHTVLALDLPGHGDSGDAPSYDVASMAGSVVEVIADAALDRPLLVGHSLGGVVVTAAATAVACRGVLNVDQPLDLGLFKAGLAPLEPGLRGDEDSFQQAMAAVFESMAGPLSGDERARIEALRQARQDVVLAIWAPVFESSPAELDAVVRAVADGLTVPYLSLHGIDPGDGYAAWLADLVPGAQVEVWADHGHFPHLVAPDRFLARLAAFESTLA
jgi:pimeloyl-ACP methyl ester carboxylesterase